MNDDDASRDLELEAAQWYVRLHLPHCLMLIIYLSLWMHHAKTYWLNTTIFMDFLLPWILGVRDSGEARQSLWGLPCSCGGCWSGLGPSQRVLHSHSWCWAGETRPERGWGSRGALSISMGLCSVSLCRLPSTEFRGAGLYVCWLRGPKDHVPRENPGWMPSSLFFPT